MAVDGYLKFNTKIDTSGFDSDANKISAKAKTTASEVSATASATKSKIQAILDDSQRSNKSKAASIAAIYRKEGMEISEAMEKAWSHIERGSAEACDNISKHTKRINISISSVRSLLGKLGAAVSSVFAVKGIVDFGKQAIETASDIQEVQNVVDVAFGSMKNKMEEFADSAIETYGISKLTAKQTGSTYMAMAKGMQIADDAASDMAVTLTGLSADMASFYNKEQSATATALNSVFTGETETLKTYGIVMTEANLQQFAYTQGINKKISAMSQAEKVQLRYNYVLSQTALAQGDFSRTSGNWANQTRILSEQWKEFSGIVGTALINILLPAVQMLNSAMSSLISFANKALSALSELFGWDLDASFGGASVDAAVSSVDSLTDSQEALTDATNATAEANERSLAGFDKINKLSDASSGGVASGGSAGTSSESNDDSDNTDTSRTEAKMESFAQKVKDSFNELKTWWDTNFSCIFSGLWTDLTVEATELKTTLETVFSDLQTLAEPLKNYFSDDFTTSLQTTFSTMSSIITGLFDTFNLVFGDIWNVALFPFIQSLTTSFLPTVTQISTSISSFLSSAFTSVKTLFDEVWTNGIKPALTVAVQMVTDLFDSVEKAWNKWGKPVFDNLKIAFESTVNTIKTFWDTILKPIWDKLVTAIKDIWDKHLKPLVDNFLDFVGEFVNGALEIYNKFILPIVNWLVEKFGPPISKIFQSVVDWIKNAIAKAVDILNGMITCLKGVVQFIAGIFTGDWKKAWDGIKTYFSGLWNNLVTIVSGPIDKIKTFFTTLSDSIKNTFSSIPNWFRDKFSEAWTKVKNVFSSGGKVFDGIKDGILNGLKTVINGLISGINRVIATPFNGINTALRRVRDISIAGVQPFKNRISLINVPQIPKLATGTVVPANYGEFLAVLGDNKREAEVVSPLSTMKQALAEVLAAQGGGGDIHITATLDGDVVYKNVVKKNKQNTKRTGVNALAG